MPGTSDETKTQINYDWFFFVKKFRFYWSFYCGVLIDFQLRHQADPMRWKLIGMKSFLNIFAITILEEWKYILINLLLYFAI